MPTKVPSLDQHDGPVLAGGCCIGVVKAETSGPAATVYVVLTAPCTSHRSRLVPGVIERYVPGTVTPVEVIET